MKRITVVLTAAFILLLTNMVLITPKQAAAVCGSNLAILYGMTKPDGRHFYTTNSQEVAQVMQYNFKYSGVVGVLYAQPVPNGLPIQRYYNSATGSHRYFASSTIDESKGTHEGILGYISTVSDSASNVEMSYAVNDSRQDVLFGASEQDLWQTEEFAGYIRQGSLGFICDKGRAMDPQLTVYRYWNPNSQKHFYTTSKTEGDGVVKSAGFKYEGIAGYIFYESKNVSGGVNDPIYRLYNPGLQKHFYTTNESEKQILTTMHGYIFEGTLGYTAGTYPGITMHRLYNAKTADHLFTTDNLEVGRAEKAGYVKESALGFINPHVN